MGNKYSLLAFYLFLISEVCSIRYFCYGYIILVFCKICCIHSYWLYCSTYFTCIFYWSSIGSFAVKYFCEITGVFITLLNFRTKILEVTDQRVKIMSEIIKSMRIVKMYCWESAFNKKIRLVRK